MRWTEIVGGRWRPSGLAPPEKAVIAQMIIDVGDQALAAEAPRLAGLTQRLRTDSLDPPQADARLSQGHRVAA